MYLIMLSLMTTPRLLFCSAALHRYLLCLLEFLDLVFKHCFLILLLFSLNLVVYYIRIVLH